MRLDKFLKNSRIIKRRTVAKTAADAGRISVNGRVAKAGTDISVGDILDISLGRSNMKVEVLDLPEVVRKDEGKDMYKLIGDDNEQI